MINTIISVVDILGFIQGIIFGVILTTLKKNKAALILGLFIIAYASEFANPIFEFLSNLKRL